MRSAHIILLVLVFLFSGISGNAQNRRDKVEALRVAYITKHVGFTVSEAERFWPVYNEYNDKVHALKKSFRQTYSQYSETMSEQEVQELYTTEQRMRQAEYDVHRMYSVKIRAIIG